MIITYRQIHSTDKYSQHMSIIWPNWLNGWVFFYELTGCGFESRCRHIDSCLTITQVCMKEYWKNPVNFPWTLKGNINSEINIEIYKTLNNLNPSFMKEIFELILCSRPVREQCKLNLNIPRKRQVTFGTKIKKCLGPKIWNNLPYHINPPKIWTYLKTLLKNGMVLPVVAMCVPYRYLSTILFHRWLLCYFCKFYMQALHKI